MENERLLRIPNEDHFLPEGEPRSDKETNFHPVWTNPETAIPTPVKVGFDVETLSTPMVTSSHFLKD